MAIAYKFKSLNLSYSASAIQASGIIQKSAVTYTQDSDGIDVPEYGPWSDVAQQLSASMPLTDDVQSIVVYFGTLARDIALKDAMQEVGTLDTAKTALLAREIVV